MIGSPTRPPKPRGFSLIELLVALGLGVGILTVTMALTSQAVEMRNQARIKMELNREGAFASSALTHEIKQAGLGLPWGENINGGGKFYAGLIVGTDEGVGIVADLPRPDAQYNVIGPMLAVPSGDQTHVAWFNENNGSCVPSDNANSCLTGATSVFFPGEDGCSTDGSTDPEDQRTCPWGLRRLVADERLQIISGEGTWATAAVKSGGPKIEQIGLAGKPQFSMLLLDPGWPATWPNDNVEALPVGQGTGFVTTLDRLFVYKDGTNLMRLQCWGDPDPDNSDWPSADSAAPASPAAAAAVNANTTCVGPEVIARNVSNAQFTYRRFDGTVLTTPLVGAAIKKSVATVQFELTLAKTHSGKTISHTVTGEVGLRN